LDTSATWAPYALHFSFRVLVGMCLTSGYIAIFAVSFAHVRRRRKSLEQARAAKGGIGKGELTQVTVTKHLKDGILNATKEWKSVLQAKR
jgi:hypothetical protein